jgi:hypothetical protein
MNQSNCSYCGNQFVPANVMTKLCSDDCRVQSRRAAARKAQRYVSRPKLATICEQCGQTFISKKAGTRMCSDLCRHANAAKKKQSVFAKGRKCIRCGIDCKSKPGKPVCSNCRIDKRDPVKAAEKERLRRFRRYGLTEEEYNRIFSAQGQRCAVCLTDTPSSKGWQIDHCHSTGKVRGILCVYCNTGLGSFMDDTNRLQSAIRYLSANS